MVGDVPARGQEFMALTAVRNSRSPSYIVLVIARRNKNGCNLWRSFPDGKKKDAAGQR